MRKHGGLVEKRRRRKVTSRSTEKTHALKKTRQLNLIQNFKIIRLQFYLKPMQSKCLSTFLVSTDDDVVVTDQTTNGFGLTSVDPIGMSLIYNDSSIVLS